jgi:hypothetical protein
MKASYLSEAERVKDIPSALNRMVDVAPAYRPKPKTKGACKRVRAKKKDVMKPE